MEWARYNNIHIAPVLVAVTQLWVRSRYISAKYLHCPLIYCKCIIWYVLCYHDILFVLSIPPSPTTLCILQYRQVTVTTITVTRVWLCGSVVSWLFSITHTTVHSSASQPNSMAQQVETHFMTSWTIALTRDVRSCIILYILLYIIQIWYNICLCSSL